MSIGKILICDDDRNICELLRLYLEKEGYTLSIANDGEEALAKFNADTPDLILLDIMMPKLDGWQVCREIRKKSNCPIIMITAKGETFDKVLGLELGSDDYVVKPFSPKEVMARVHVIISRNARQRKEEPQKEPIKLDGLTIDMAGRNVYVDGVKAEMTPKEYDLLFYLVRNQNLALTRDKLLNDVWGYEFFGDDRTVDTHIKMLRNSLGKYRDYIVTLRGLGYKFEVEET